MKKALANIFVVLINYYTCSFFIGIVLAFSTMFIGALNSFIVLAIAILSLVFCIVYQLSRDRWAFYSIGEIVVGNIDKTNILHQRKSFSITRIPIFLVVLIIVIMNGNLLDGLGSGQIYNVSNAILFGVILLVVYTSLKNFFLRPTVLSIFLMTGGLLFVAVAFKRQEVIMSVYYGFTICWLLIALFYKSKAIKETNEVGLLDK